MTALLWDQVGERVFQTGVDRGVLYPSSGFPGVAWNGLTSVTEQDNREVKSYYMEGIKYLEFHVLGEYSATLKAITYPDEFDEINGIIYDDGLTFHDQRPSSFGLAYRTLIGDDIAGTDRGYNIHLHWNVRATPANVPYESMNDRSNPIMFEWALTSVPEHSLGHRSTSHITIDSTKIAPEDLAVLEATLYGTDSAPPTLPSLSEVIDLVSGGGGGGTGLCVSSTDTPVALSDSTIATATITMPVVGDDIISYVTVAYYLNVNMWAYDYIVKLTHPDSTEIILADRGGGASAIDPIIITPRVGIPDSSWAVNAEGGEYRAYPDDLSTLAGKSISGVWTVTITGQGYFPDPPDDVASLDFLELCAYDSASSLPTEFPLVADFDYTVEVL